jgi:hypothetical protein
MAVMKKTFIFIPSKTILITLLFTIAGTTAALCNSMPPPPSGLEEPPAVGIDLYVIPMIILGIIFTFFLLEKILGYKFKKPFYIIKT